MHTALDATATVEEELLFTWAVAEGSTDNKSNKKLRFISLHVCSFI